MIRNILIISVNIFILTGCLQEEKKVEKKRAPIENMTQKVVKKVTKEKPLSKVVEEDGIVVDGARDEKLLDAFGLAVSQVMINEGVSVPNCESLSKTGFLSKEECEEITEKYTGFYEVTEDGGVVKVDNIFDQGIKGKGVELSEGIEFFDSSGNPLLDNEIEFNEYVANNNDLDILKKLKAEIPKEKIEMLKNIEQKIGFLEEVNSIQDTRVEQKVDKKIDNGNFENDLQVNPNDFGINNDSNDFNDIEKRLSAAKIKLAEAEAKYNQFPTEKHRIELLEAQSEVDFLEGQLQ